MTSESLNDTEARIIVRERLKILAIGFYIRGAMVAFFSLFFFIYAGFFLAVSFVPASAWNQPPRHAALPAGSAAPAVTPTPSPSSITTASPRAEGPPVVIFRIIGSIMGGVVLLMLALACLTAYAGRCIQKRKSKILIYIMAGFNCLFIPYGTLLGVFTFIVMSSPPALREFDSAGS